MVLQAIFDFGLWLFEFISQAIPSAQPVLYSATNLFNDVLSIGIWVIGDDMWSIFLTAVSGWLTFKLVWGTILFIYRLIPLI